jgi:hypothetical protein
VKVDAPARRIVISPHIPRDLYGKNLALENLLLPGGSRLSVHIRQSAGTRAQIAVETKGTPSESQFVISLPGTSAERMVRVQPQVRIEFR